MPIHIEAQFNRKMADGRTEFVREIPEDSVHIDSSGYEMMVFEPFCTSPSMAFSTGWMRNFEACWIPVMETDR